MKTSGKETFSLKDLKITSPSKPEETSYFFKCHLAFSLLLYLCRLGHYKVFQRKTTWWQRHKSHNVKRTQLFNLCVGLQATYNGKWSSALRNKQITHKLASDFLFCAVKWRCLSTNNALQSEWKSHTSSRKKFLYWFFKLFWVAFANGACSVPLKQKPCFRNR